MHTLRGLPLSLGFFLNTTFMNLYQKIVNKVKFKKQLRHLCNVERGMLLAFTLASTEENKTALAFQLHAIETEKQDLEKQIKE